MELLEQKIRKEGKVYAGDVLKVDGFLNHRMDVEFLCLLGKEFYRLFADCGVNKILTIEASGIGIACIAAQYFNVPVVFAKKHKKTKKRRLLVKVFIKWIFIITTIFVFLYAFSSSYYSPIAFLFHMPYADFRGFSRYAPQEAVLQAELQIISLLFHVR